MHCIAHFLQSRLDESSSHFIQLKSQLINLHVVEGDAVVDVVQILFQSGDMVVVQLACADNFGFVHSTYVTLWSTPLLDYFFSFLHPFLSFVLIIETLPLKLHPFLEILPPPFGVYKSLRPFFLLLRLLVLNLLANFLRSFGIHFP